LADGKCLTIANNCSLRAAVMQADTSRDPLTVINVPAGTYMLTRLPSRKIDGSNGNLDLSAPALPGLTIYIIGAGAARTIIDANKLDNVLDIRGRRDATLAGLTLRNGRAVTGPSGGIIANIGGILTISDWRHRNAQAGDVGGGIYNSGSMDVYRSTIRSNSSGRGGGLFTSGVTRLYDSTISGNQAIDGGGIYNESVTTLLNSTSRGTRP
jgi:hypothetical protein